MLRLALSSLSQQAEGEGVAGWGSRFGASIWSELVETEGVSQAEGKGVVAGIGALKRRGVDRRLAKVVAATGRGSAQVDGQSSQKGREFL